MRVALGRIIASEMSETSTPQPSITWSEWAADL